MIKTKGKSMEELLEEALVPKEEQPYEVPENWLWVRSGKVANWGSGGTPSRKYPEYYNGNIPWIKTGDLNNSIVDEVEEYISEEGLAKSSAKIFPKGSLAIAMYGATIGKLGILGLDAATNQACAVGHPLKLLNPVYMYYFFLSNKQVLINLGKGGAQPNISQLVIKSFPFVLPPLNEQERIADKIESLFAKIDEAKRLIAEAKASFELRRASILDKAFRGELTRELRADNQNIQDVSYFINNLRQKEVKTEILADLKGWKLVQLKDLFSIYGGGTPSKSKEDYWKGSIPWLSPKDMKSNYLKDTMDHISNEAVDNSAVKLLNGGSVSIVVRSGILKHSLPVAILDTPYTINQDMKAFDSGDCNINEYLLWYIIGNEREFLTIYSKSGTTVGSIVFEKFKNHYLPLPPYEELKQILILIKKFIIKEVKTTQLIDELQVETLKQSILQKAFRSELGTNDPTEESAIELLKEALNSQKK
ncbi:restriction endonuclease subunit S [Paenibacillus medicaginis]|uniref:Restriction endonuclease subunit S n=1 Tax=Paenibacillus medicaginis TaxID=1470560 RepID=A0ABV5C083_9BACL